MTAAGQLLAHAVPAGELPLPDGVALCGARVRGLTPVRQLPWDGVNRRLRCVYCDDLTVDALSGP